MKKWRNAFLLLLSAVLLLAVCVPTVGEAKEGKSGGGTVEAVTEGAETGEKMLEAETSGAEIEKMESLEARAHIEALLQDSSRDAEQVIEELLKEKDVVCALLQVSRDTRDVFYERLTEEELHIFAELYRYLMVADMAEHYESDEPLSLYLEFLSKIKEKQQKSGKKEISTAIKRQENGEKEITALTKRQENTEEEEVQEAVLSFLRKLYSELPWVSEPDIEQDKSVYLESVQKKTALFDVGILTNLLDELKAAESEAEEENAYERVKAYLKECYEKKEGVNDTESALKVEKFGMEGRTEEADTAEQAAELDSEASGGVGVTYRAYMQSTGWQEWKNNGGTAGNTADALRMEALQMKVEGDLNLGISYNAHVQGIGWQGVKVNGATAGTTGQSKRIEAIRIELTGTSAVNYDVYYRTFCESYGWLDWAKNGQSAGTLSMSKRLQAIQIKIVAKGSVAPGATAVPMRTNSVARIGNTYYPTLKAAFDALSDGETIYVIKSHSISTANEERIFTTKSFSLYPEENNIKITWSYGEPEHAGIICTPEGDSTCAATWTIGGNKGYTLTIDANGYGESGVISSGAKPTMNLKSGCRLCNSSGNGVWNEYGTINIYDGVKVYGNQSHGLCSRGNINMYGGEVYNNDWWGLVAQKKINLSGGQVYGNKVAGVMVGNLTDSACVFTMTGGSIHGNMQGVYAEIPGAALKISAGTITGNEKTGIYTSAKTDISGSAAVYSNGSEGVYVSENTTTVSDGSIYNNTGAGISNKGTLKVSGGKIYSNQKRGVFNSGTMTLSGGEITSNTVPSGSGGGIYCGAGANLTLSGGVIAGNTAGQVGNGVYFNGASFRMSGDGAVDIGNNVYLAANKYITVNSALTAEKAAMITPSNYANGRKVAETAYGKKLGSISFQKFLLTPKNTYCLRPGDYQASQANTGDSDVVVSTRYQVTYNKNCDGTAENIPSAAQKYWYESAKISALIPKAGIIKFLGWSENAQAEKAAFQPGATLEAGINRDVTLYAIWGTKIKITYYGNGSDTGTEKTEYTTAAECMEKQGYTLRDNESYTKFTKKGAVFAGWNISADGAENKVDFPKGTVFCLTFEELLELVEKQSGFEAGETDDLAEIGLYAAWDFIPEISADEVLEFYEGTEVTKEMLLANLKAEDKEDGDISENLRILKIEYAKGRIEGGTKQESKTESWKMDMPEEYQLDTWFLQLDKADSPVTHYVTYAVTDSTGNEAVFRWPVKVLYNEYPTLEAEDRYFTLEEAKSGMITEESLLTIPLQAGTIHAADKEDDERNPGEIQRKIQLRDFHPEEFTAFEESGFVTVTYSVQDSMGPDGAGKETFTRCTVYIVKDGEITRPEKVQYVRFISQKYFEKNLEKAAGISASEEVEEEEERNGGLRLHSKWYQEPSYKNILSAVWEEDARPEEVWRLDKEDVKEVKKYIESHGIGNSVEESALSGFSAKFGNLKNE